MRASVSAPARRPKCILFGDNPENSSRLREAVRRVSDPGLVRENHRPDASLWPPTGERRTLSLRHRPHGFHHPTVAYVARRTADGRTKREIIRCLKRFLAREIYQRVMTDARQTLTQAA